MYPSNDIIKHNKYFGYNLSSGDEYGLILHDCKDRNICYVPAYEILNQLLYEIRLN